MLLPKVMQRGFELVDQRLGALRGRVETTLSVPLSVTKHS